MSVKKDLEKQLEKAELDLRRSKHFKEAHADRSNKRQKQLAAEFADKDAERVYRLKRQLGKTR